MTGEVCPKCWQDDQTGRRVKQDIHGGTHWCRRCTRSFTPGDRMLALVRCYRPQGCRRFRIDQRVISWGRP